MNNALLTLLYDIHWVTLYTFCIVSISNFLEKVCNIRKTGHKCIENGIIPNAKQKHWYREYIFSKNYEICIHTAQK